MAWKQQPIMSETYEMVGMQSTALLENNPEKLKSGGWKQALIPRSLQGRFTGWRAALLLWATIAGFVCLLNVLLTIWATSRNHLNGGVSYLYTGSCKDTARMNLWLHIGINLFSTLLLSASNYTMQVVASPTRAEVDNAHRASRWLDIGVPGIRNLGSIKPIRRLWWALLAFSSIPLHLLYNSAVFQSLSANEYDYIGVSENFLQPTAVINATLHPYDNDLEVLIQMHEAALNGSLVKYDSASCMAMYASVYVSKARNVLLVSESPANYTYEDDCLSFNSWEGSQIPYTWICGEILDGDEYDVWDESALKDGTPVCTLAAAVARVGNWTVGSASPDSTTGTISYCMIEETPEECSLQFNLPIMLIVIAANLVKLSVIIWVLLNHKVPVLITIGDAVASFLERPDLYTTGICLSTREDILRTRGQWAMHPARQWIPRRDFWSKATSWKRLLTCYILCLSIMVIGIVCFLIGTKTIGTAKLSSLYKLGFGTVTPIAIVNFSTGGLISTVLFANLPQAILSFLYLFYNGLYSSFLSAHEWSKFGHSRKSLRVTDPSGDQRSTYFLSFPYRYAIPLMILSCTLHWLISQSLYLALVTVRNDLGIIDPIQSFVHVGFSCIAIFCALVVGAIALLTSFVLGFRRYDAGIPLVGSCSAAISASCHRISQESGDATRPLQWGVVLNGYVGHCCFSSLEVGEPVEGRLYAGLKVKEE